MVRNKAACKTVWRGLLSLFWVRTECRGNPKQRKTEEQNVLECDKIFPLRYVSDPAHLIVNLTFWLQLRTHCSHICTGLGDGKGREAAHRLRTRHGLNEPKEIIEKNSLNF